VKPLCPECIEGHIKGHAAKGTVPDIETLQSAVSRCGKKLRLALDYLNSEFRGEADREHGDLDRQRRRLHQAIDEIFDRLAQPSQTNSTYNALVKRSIAEIEMMASHLHSESGCLESIRKAFLLNLEGLWDELHSLKTSRSGAAVSASRVDEIIALVRRLP
jgi:hypothetical protein